MYSRSIITENNDQNSDIHFSYNWDFSHPGKENIIFISEYIKPRIDQSIHEIVSYDGTLVYIFWNSIIQIGFVTTFSFDINSFDNDILLFSTAIWDIQSSKPESKKEFDKLLLNTSSSIDLTYKFDIEWLKISLTGGTILFDIFEDKNKFVSIFSNFISKFRWIFFSLKYALIKENEIEFSFFTLELDHDYQYENYFLSIIDSTRYRFQSLLNLSINKLISYPQKDRMRNFIEYLDVFYNFLDEEKPISELLELLIRNGTKMISIDEKFITSETSNLVIKISQMENSFELIDELLHLSDIFHNTTQVDLIKLIDGTTLEIVMLDTVIDKEEYLINLTQKSIRWGITHVIGYLHSLSSMMSNKNDLELLEIILKQVESDLDESWEGLLCLSEIYYLIGYVNKAAIYRLEATNINGDPLSKSFDIFNALNEISSFNNLDEEYFLDNFLKYFHYGIKHIPSADIFESYVNNLLENLLKNNKTLLISSIVDWVQYHIDEIGINDRLTLLKLFTNKLSKTVTLSQSYLKVQLLQFNQLLEQYALSDDQLLLKQADQLLKSIFNNVDPLQPKYKETLTIITQSLILSATNYEEWELIQESIHRFNLLLKDEIYYSKALIQIYINAGKLRSKLNTNKLSKNDIGLRIFDECIRIISQPPSQSDIALSFLPLAKDLAIKVGDTDRFTIYSTLEMNLNRISKNDWVDTLIDSAITLLNSNKVNSARLLFDTSLTLELSKEEEYEILSRQLELAEIELDIIKVEEISIKRDRMIELALNNQGIANEGEIMDSYRNGISEILSKGSSHHLNTFLINAINFGVSQGIEDLTDFINTLDDSFSSILINYTGMKDQKSYNELLYIIRSLNQIYSGGGIDRIMVFTIKLLESNFSLYKKTKLTRYIYYNLQIFEELSKVLEIRKNIFETDLSLDKLLKLCEKLINLTISEKTSFDIYSIVIDLVPFYCSINKFTTLSLVIDKIFTDFKKQLIKKKGINTGFIPLLLSMGLVYKLLIKFDYNERGYDLVNKCIKLINVILSLSRIGSDFNDKLEELTNYLNDDPLSGFLILEEGYSEFLELVDLSNNVSFFT